MFFSKPVVAFSLLFFLADVVHAQDRVLVKKQARPTPETLAQIAGLKWVVAQQQADGGWMCDQATDTQTKKDHPCLGRNGATALALLTVHDAWDYPRDKREYQDCFKKGLEYLVKNAENNSPAMYSWIDAEGGQLSHALVTMLLCEVYGGTKDKEVLPYAQGGIDYIAANVDQQRHGWGIQLGAAPSLEVTVWQLLALKSGAMAYLNVNQNVIKNATLALNDMAPPDADYEKFLPTDLAQAIIARVYLGWKADNEGIQKSIPLLSKYAPTYQDPSTTFYVGRCMHKLTAETRKTWLVSMPPAILAGQVKSDHIPNNLSLVLLPGETQTDDQSGSWPPGSSTSPTRLGRNRLESTCLMLLSLNYALSKSRQNERLADHDCAKVDDSFPL